MAEQKRVIIYSTPTCVYCKAAKDFFKENNIEFEEKDVAADQQAQQEMVQKSGGMSVPVIDVGGDITVGFDKEHLSRVLGVGA